MAELAYKEFNSTKCPAPKVDGPGFNKATTLYAFVGSVGVFFLLILAAILIVRFSQCMLNISCTQVANATIAYEAVPLLSMDGHKADALLFNPILPFLVRYGILLILLVNIALFIASNTSLGASVYLLVKTPTGTTQFPSLFNFSLGNSVRDMWNAKVYALSILIALFSGVWPYTKLVLMIICWCVPAGILSIRRRGHILIMLDAMGKWSLIDTFVLMMMMVAFHFSLTPPVSNFTPDGTISFEAYVEPHFGFYSFLVATMLSLVLTHLVIRAHQYAIEETGNIFILRFSLLLTFNRCWRVCRFFQGSSLVARYQRNTSTFCLPAHLSIASSRNFGSPSWLWFSNSILRIRI